MKNMNQPNIFSDLDSEQVLALRKLLMFLRRLRIIGKLHVNVTSETVFGPIVTDDLIDGIYSSKNSYRVKKLKYDYEKTIDQEELLESLFGRLVVGPI